MNETIISSSVPAAHPGWKPVATGATYPRLASAIAEVSGWVTAVPVDIKAFKLDENLVEYREGEHGAITGPMPRRGPATGLVVHRGVIAGSWGEPGKADIAFSVTKGALATIAALAIGDGLIASIDDPVAKTVHDEAFSGPRNGLITWRHLLTLTSEWRGSLWGIPDSIDWNRAVPKLPDSPQKGTPREVRPPGGYWEFNDVRVNVLAFALTLLFREGLGVVLRRRVLDPIGASQDWSWNGLGGAEINLDGRAIPVVAGGAHWGGGLLIPAFDLARLGLLYARSGKWGDAQILPAGWLAEVQTPTPLNDSFGKMWWTNRNNGVPPLSRSAIWGSGIAHFIGIDPDRDLVIVLRWYDVRRRDELLARLVAALPR